jgi:hypothetical protein
MQQFTKRSDEPEEKPDVNVHSNVRMTIQEAAAAMGITVEAVRGRINRGKYKREKSEDGRVFVLLTPEQLANGHERFDERSPERSRDQTTNVPERDQALVEELVEELAEGLRQEVEFLREELARRNEELRRREEEHQEESRRKDSIIMAMTQRIPELEAPRDTPEPSQTVFRDKDGEEAPPDQERRSWWQRLFGAPPSHRI